MSQKGQDKGNKARIFRTNIGIPNGETPSKRSAIELLFDCLPEPIDLELDKGNKILYWTDCGEHLKAAP